GRFRRLGRRGGSQGSGPFASRSSLALGLRLVVLDRPADFATHFAEIPDRPLCAVPRRDLPPAVAPLRVRDAPRRVLGAVDLALDRRGEEVRAPRRRHRGSPRVSWTT